MIVTASHSDLDTQWHSRVRATLVLATWADALGAMPEAAAALADGPRQRPPVGPVLPARQTAAMWVLAEHLSRHGGTVVQAELGRALIGQRGHSRSPGTGLYTSDPNRVPRSRSWSSTSLTSRGLLTRSSLVNTAPVGLVPDIDMATVARRARRAAALAQAHPQALDLATIQAVAVAVVARYAGRPVNADAMIDEMSAQICTPELRMALRRVPPLVRQSAHPQRVAGQLHGYSDTASTVSVALTAFLHHPDDPIAALRFASNVGGDVRATMVTTGALCGAHHGELTPTLPIEIPERLSRIAATLARLRVAA